MKELDRIKVKRTVRARPLFKDEDELVMLETGWMGTIVADADTATPLVEFTQYAERPILVALAVDNLELVIEQN